MKIPTLKASKRRSFHPPSSLSKPARDWWRRVLSEYAIDDAGGLLLLQTALESFDRMLEAQEAISQHGMMIKDRFGQLRANPACALERDSRIAMLAALRQLHLDIEPLRDGPGRPPGSR